jgi:hypothetical protein
MRKKLGVFFFSLPWLALSSPIYSPSRANTPSLVEPWFTGPLLAPETEVTPISHFGIEPLFSYTVLTGLYDNRWKAHSFENFYSSSFALWAGIGLTSFMDIAFEPQVFYQWTKSVHSTGFGDIPFDVHFQLCKANDQTALPDLILALRGTIPTGRYSNLNPNKLLTDATGLGSWFPGVTLSTGKLLYLSQRHLLIPRFSIGYLISTPVSVKNFNFYGGGIGTKGTVYPGNVFWWDFSIEYSFNQRWVFALDLFYDQQSKTRFSGTSGWIAPELPATVGYPSLNELSIAPALEYNWSKNIGLIGGCWFSALGRNAYRFFNIELAFSLYI